MRASATADSLFTLLSIPEAPSLADLPRASDRQRAGQARLGQEALRPRRYQEEAQGGHEAISQGLARSEGRKADAGAAQGPLGVPQGEEQATQGEAQSDDTEEKRRKKLKKKAEAEQRRRDRIKAEETEEQKKARLASQAAASKASTAKRMKKETEEEKEDRLRHRRARQPEEGGGRGGARGDEQGEGVGEEDEQGEEDEGGPVGRGGVGGVESDAPTVRLTCNKLATIGNDIATSHSCLHHSASRHLELATLHPASTLLSADPFPPLPDLA